MPETTPLIKAALNLRGGAGFDVYETISNGIDVTINIDAFQADKSKVREELSSIFAEVLEYFE